MKGDNELNGELPLSFFASELVPNTKRRRAKSAQFSLIISTLSQSSDALSLSHFLPSNLAN